MVLLKPVKMINFPHAKRNIANLTSLLMHQQINIISYLYIGVGILTLLGAIITTIAIAGGGLLSEDETAIAVTSTVGFIIGGFIAIIGIFSLIAGVGLLKRRSWARTLTIIVSVVNLLNFPIGTALGGYALYVLLQDESKAEFRVTA